MHEPATDGQTDGPLPPKARKPSPGHEVSNWQRAWRWNFGFDLLAAIGMAVGAGTLGLMAALALAFVPVLVAVLVLIGGTVVTMRSC